MKELSEQLARAFADLAVEADTGKIDAYTVGVVETRILWVLKRYNPRFDGSIFRNRRAGLTAKARDIARRSVVVVSNDDE